MFLRQFVLFRRRREEAFALLLLILMWCSVSAAFLLLRKALVDLRLLALDRLAAVLKLA